MKRICIIYFLVFFFCISAFSQSRSDLEAERKRTLQEISEVDNILQNTAKEKKENLNSVRVLANKLSLRESVIRGMNEEIELLNERILLNRLGIEMMEDDLEMIRQNYSMAIVNAYKAKKLNPDIVYILSARDFNQGYKRIKYMQQVSRFRRSEAELINRLVEVIDESKKKLEDDLFNISDLKHREVIQKETLKSEQDRKQRLVKSLSSKEKQLQQELAEKKKKAKKIEAEINKIIAEERKRSEKSTLTPEQRLTGNNFLENKGKLPWPVERGTITGQFGVHPHPVLKNVTEENVGIEITTSGKITARAVFAGEVTAISAISGSNMTVIIRHGSYLSVYNNLVNVKVKSGDKVETKQTIGDVFSDAQTNNSVLKFMIFEKSYQDPEGWITKK